MPTDIAARVDPDLDTYYLMDGALMNLPALIDNTERLRLAAVAAARGATQTPASVREMGAYESRGDLFEERLTAGSRRWRAFAPGHRRACATRNRRS